MILNDEGHALTYSPYTTMAGRSEMSLLHVIENRWQAVELDADSPLPRVDAFRIHHSGVAESAFWLKLIQDRLDRWIYFFIIQAYIIRDN